MTVVSFSDYTPPPRFLPTTDPWTNVLIYEAPTSTGPYTLIDTLALSPLDGTTGDPLFTGTVAAPASREFTTELATQISGWYYVRWRDASNDLSTPTDPVQNLPDHYQPTIQEVAALCRTRTVGSNSPGVGLGLGSDQPGEWSETTRPSINEVYEVIDVATGYVIGDIARSFGTQLYSDVRSLVTLMSAIMIEGSYFREQTNPTTGSAALWLRLYERGVKALQDKVDSGVVVDPTDPGGAAAGWILV